MNQESVLFSKQRIKFTLETAKAIFVAKRKLCGTGKRFNRPPGIDQRDDRPERILMIFAEAILNQYYSDGLADPLFLITKSKKELKYFENRIKKFMNEGIFLSKMLDIKYKELRPSSKLFQRAYR